MGNVQQCVVEPFLPDFPPEETRLSKKEWDTIKAHIDEQLASTLDFVPGMIPEILEKNGFVRVKESTRMDKVKHIAVILGIAVLGGAATVAVDRAITRRKKLSLEEGEKEPIAQNRVRAIGRGPGVSST